MSKEQVCISRMLYIKKNSRYLSFDFLRNISHSFCLVPIFLSFFLCLCPFYLPFLVHLSLSLSLSVFQLSISLAISITYNCNKPFSAFSMNIPELPIQVVNVADDTNNSEVNRELGQQVTTRFV